MGGRVALPMASRHPERFAGLIIMDLVGLDLPDVPVVVNAHPDHLGRFADTHKLIIHTLLTNRYISIPSSMMLDGQLVKQLQPPHDNPYSHGMGL